MEGGGSCILAAAVAWSRTNHRWHDQNCAHSDNQLHDAELHGRVSVAGHKWLARVEQETHHHLTRAKKIRAFKVSRMGSISKKLECSTSSPSASALSVPEIPPSLSCNGSAGPRGHVKAPGAVAANPSCLLPGAHISRFIELQPRIRTWPLLAVHGRGRNSGIRARRGTTPPRARFSVPV